MTATATTGPTCTQHGPMSPRTARTPEQRFTGTWWACIAPRCLNAYLQPSAQLLTQLRHQDA
ncbi:hypothetical protein [Streptomyces nogalater]|uniref:Uncharacterized protein n=1 Tax=Streptomyces nogalater TaxID=38314 RepID=A0ABW0WAN8_STRNO